jgi:hypothetical protein
LAERVDYDTGIIGRSRRVSYGGIALDLSERDVARRIKDNLVKVSAREVRNAVLRLVNVGILSSMSEKGFHHDLVLSRVFFVDLLSGDNSVKNPVGITVGLQLAFIAGKFNNGINELQQNNETRIDSVGISVGITSLQHTTTTRARENGIFTMMLDWKPDDQILIKILAMDGFVLEKVNKAWISEFITYWFSRQDVLLSQPQWTTKLARLLQEYLAHPGLYEQRRGINKPGETPGFKNLDLPDWARLPRDDQQLVSWMRHFGYGDPPAGLDYKQARSFLQRQVDIRLKEWKRGLS